MSSAAQGSNLQMARLLAVDLQVRFASKVQSESDCNLLHLMLDMA